MPGHIISWLTHIPVAGGILSSLSHGALAGAQADMKGMLADVLLDPKKTAELLRLSQDRGIIPELFNNKKIQSMPGIMGATISKNKDRVTN